MPELLMLVVVFFKTGFLAFGSGYSAVAILQRELVDIAIPVIKADVYANIMAVAQMTPGPVGLNVSTYVGKIKYGLSGAVLLSAAIVFPALIISYPASKILQRNKRSGNIAGFVRGVRCLAIVLIGNAVWLFARTSFITVSEKRLSVSFALLSIFIFVLILSVKKKITPIQGILISIGLGGLYALFF